jgi:hypothetical protein
MEHIRLKNISGKSSKKLHKEEQGNVGIFDRQLGTVAYSFLADVTPESSFW